MFRRLKDVVLPFIQATDAEQVLETLDDLVRPAGVRLYGITPQHLIKAGDSVAERVIYNSDLPSGFLDTIKREYARHGGTSVVTHYARRRPPPFTYTESMRILQPTGDDRWIFNLLHDFGARDGFHCTYWPWTVCFGSAHVLKEKDFTEEMRMALYMAGSMAVSRMKEIVARPTPAPHAALSPREISVLQHLSDGLPVGEIADRMVLSETSVKTFVRRATKKLNATSQLHAVAIAVRSRLI